MEYSNLGSCTRNMIKANIDTKLAEFLSILKITDLSNITISSLQTTNVIYVKSNTECIQFDVNFIIPIDFNVDMKITYPRRAVIDEHTEIGKLRIKINDEMIRLEVLSCTNYLQRQKNVNLALSVLKRCSTVISERKLILDMLKLHSEGFITYTNHTDGGIQMICKNPINNFKYFESLWKIQFDCANNLVMDYIEFSISMLDQDFHRVVKPVINLLVEPNLPYNIKVDLWWKIVYAVSESETRDLLGYTELDDDVTFLTVGSQQANKLCKYQIESDDEDCIIVDN